MKTNTLTPELLHKMDAYWRAANYLSVGQIYLYDNPLLKRPLTLAAGALYAWGVVLTSAVGAALMAASTVIVAINARMLKLKKSTTVKKTKIGEPHG